MHEGSKITLLPLMKKFQDPPAEGFILTCSLFMKAVQEAEKSYVLFIFEGNKDNFQIPVVVQPLIKDYADVFPKGHLHGTPLREV